MANKSTNTLRSNLSKTMPKFQYICKKRNFCPINEFKLCHRTNVVYKIECKICKNFYIGSTSQYLHDRVEQHLSNKEGSVHQHLLQEHQLNDPTSKKKNIIVSIIFQCPSMKDLLPVEAIYTKPHIGKNYLLNKKEELKDIICLIT